MTSDPQQAARFKVRQFGFYAGDQWRIGSNFSLTYGVRMDIPTFPDKPTANPVAECEFRIRDRRSARRRAVVTAGRLQLRARAEQHGTDPRRFRALLRPHAVRVAVEPVRQHRQSSSAGCRFRSSRPTATCRSVPTRTTSRETLGNIPANEIDVIDPDYKYPSLMRGNLAYDRELGVFGLVGTAEFLYTKNVNDIKYQNLNLVQIGTRPDGRPQYARNRVPTLSDVILLTNTDQGDAWSIAFKVDRPYRNRFFMSASYLYGESTSIMDGTSSQAASNFINVYRTGDVNNPPTTRSNFDPGHRITISGGYDIPMGAGYTLTASLFYSGQSGRPWAALFNGDYNGDTSSYERPALHPGQRERSDVHQRHRRGLPAVHQQHVLPVGFHRAARTSATRAGRRGRTRWTSGSTWACRSSASKRRSRGIS